MTHDTGEIFCQPESNLLERSETLSSRSTPGDEQRRRTAAGRASKSQGAGGGRPRVAVVDDDEMVGDALELLIGDCAEVDVFCDPRRFLKSLDGGDYDVVFCDLIMPKMTGMEVYEALEQMAPQTAQRVVVITGGAITGRARKFLSESDVPVLRKPVDRDQLVEHIDRLTSATAS